jgi:D-alanine transaminase
MSEFIWLNGEIIPFADARIGVEDRGFQFADGVYEVIRLYNGKPFTLAEHLERLERSCNGISLAMPMPRAQLVTEIARFLSHAPLKDGMVYLQVTRGAAPRNHIFSDSKPTLLFYTRALPPVPKAGQGEGVKLMSIPDERWKRCWVKSIALLPNVLAKNAAVSAGADEAVFVEDGLITECSASNFFAVLDRKLITHPVGPKVLPGITRKVLLDLAEDVDVQVVERPVSEAEALHADELFITSTTREIAWVSHWNGREIAPGHAGGITLRLHKALQEKVGRESK